MQLPEIAIRRPVFATVLSLLVLLIGAVSFTKLPVREYPKIDEPVVTVTVRYAGASAEVVESQVAKPLEDSIAGIDAVDVITSISRAEQAQITVRFRLEKDADAAAAEVRDRTSRVRNKLPQAIDEPVIAKVEADAFPVIWLAFSSDTHSELQLNELINRIVKPRLQTVTGAADVRIFGERKYAMRVWLDPDRLAAYKLTTQDAEEAREIAAQLSRLNEERRSIEMAVQEAAEAQVERQSNRSVVVLAGKGWHPGVIGIVAGRLKEKTGKPTLVIALDDDDAGYGKGSGRSISGVDLGAAIIGARELGYLVAGGGHAMAAGLTVAPDRLDDFAQWLDDRLAGDVGRAQGAQSLLLDLAVAPRGLQPELVELLESAGPYGMGWPGPRVAVGPVRVVKADVVGADHLRLIVRGEDGASFKAMAFRAAQSDMGQTLLHGHTGRKLWLAGRARIDDWGSRRAAELHVDDAAWAD